MPMSYKKFILIVLTILMIVVGSAASFIYYIDPMWTFGHKNEHNDVQTVIDERQQKTNAIHFQPFDYDTLLIGSSRATYINQHDFEGMKVYNYSASNLSVREYEPFLDYATEKNKKPFERVILGIDFFKTSTSQSSTPLNLDSQIAKLEEPFYRYKNLLSYDLLQYAYDNYKMSKENTVTQDRNYNRDNVADTVRIDPEQTIEQTKEKIKKFRKEFYGETYEYNPDYKKVLIQLKEKYPDTQFIIFTTPISTPLFQALVEEGRLLDYEQWLTDVIDVFGGVYNFMYPNTITNDITNYFDGHHFYPEVGTMIVHRIDGTMTGVPDDFGQYVTKENLEDHFEFVESKAEMIKSGIQ
jgi:hypothetical protein